jgi:hypothetical protein
MSDSKIIGTPFTPANAPRQGRMKGSRNKLGADFLYELQREFEQHGEEAIRIVRIEKRRISQGHRQRTAEGI